MDIDVDEIEALRKDLQSLRESVLVLATKLDTLDLPSQIKGLSDKIETVSQAQVQTNTRVTVMEQRVAPLVAGISLIGAAVISAIVALFIK